MKSTGKRRVLILRSPTKVMLALATIQEIYATCSWDCHDHGCTHGSGGLLEESALEVIRYLSAGFDPFYQEINLILFVLVFPSLAFFLWSRAFHLKSRWPLLFAGTLLFSILLFPAKTYDLGVEITLFLANLTPLAYIEMSGLLFVFLMPLLSLLGFLLRAMRSPCAV